MDARALPPVTAAGSEPRLAARAGSWLVPAAALLAFSALAVVLFGDTWAHPAAAWIGDDTDAHLFIWYLGWTPHQLVRLGSPLFTTDLQYPAGANLTWNTAILAPAVLLWPVTAAFGPVVAYNVLVTGSVALSAWSGFLAARRLVGSALAAGIAGLLYGFSPFMLAESLRHPHVTLAVFPPAALILLHEILVRRRRRPQAAGGLLGLAAAVQLLSGEEVLALTVVVAALGVALLAALHRREAAVRARHALPALAWAAASFAVVAAYPVAFQLLGPRRLWGALQPPNVYVTDLLAFVVPPGGMALSSGATVAETARFTGNASENGAYLGVPLLLLLAAATLLGRRRALVRWAAPLTAAVALLSLGPRLHVGGWPLPVPLPWALLGGLPLLDSVLPARLMLLAFLGAGLVLADLVRAVAVPILGRVGAAVLPGRRRGGQPGSRQRRAGDAHRRRRLAVDADVLAGHRRVPLPDAGRRGLRPRAVARPPTAVAPRGDAGGPGPGERAAHLTRGPGRNSP